MKKIMIIALLFNGYVFANDAPSFKPQSQDILNNFVKTMLDDDNAMFLKGSKSFIDVQTVSSSELISAYQKNELSANKKYKGKSIRIRTVASSINEDALGNAYITANGKNSFENIMMYVDKNDDRVLSLSKKDKIDFVCNGDGFLLGSPVLKRCEFTSDFIKPIYDKITTSAEKASNENYKPESLMEANIVLLFKILEPEISDSCKSSGDVCLKSTKAAVKAGKFKKELLEPYAPIIKGLPESPRM